MCGGVLKFLWRSVLSAPYLVASGSHSLKPLGGGLILYCEKIDQCFGECYLERLYSIYLASNDSQESLDGR